jgi:hypothetical protein
MRWLAGSLMLGMLIPMAAAERVVFSVFASSIYFPRGPLGAPTGLIRSWFRSER